MATLGVRWGATPDISGSMRSLGASLAGAVDAAPSGSKAAKDAAYINSLDQHNAVYQQQAQKLAAETAAKQAEADRSAQDYSSQQTAGNALGEAAALKMPHPPLVLSPNEPAIVQYNADTEATRAAAPFVLAGGGTTDARAKGVKEFYNPMPVPVETKQTADKAVFNKDKTMQLIPDPKNPGRFTQVPVGGISAGSNNQEAIDAVTRANSAYKRLSDAGGVGPIVGSEWGRTAGHYLSTDNSKLRDEYEAARNKLILMERQRLMRGQGAVSDFDAKQIENMFPKFDSTDPQVGMRTLGEMQKRLTAGQSLYDPKGENQTDTSGIDPRAVEMLRKDPSLASHFDEKYGEGASAGILGQ